MRTLRSILTCLTLALAGPTLLVPVHAWHRHAAALAAGPAACAESAAEQHEPAHDPARKDAPCSPRRPDTCAICALAGTLAATLNTDAEAPQQPAVAFIAPPPAEQIPVRAPFVGSPRAPPCPTS
ncbi:MAG: hypothetical protein AB1716_03615 [Planctomycetota bacterium]